MRPFDGKRIVKVPAKRQDDYISPAFKEIRVFSAAPPKQPAVKLTSALTSDAYLKVVDTIEKEKVAKLQAKKDRAEARKQSKVKKAEEKASKEKAQLEKAEKKKQEKIEKLRKQLEEAEKDLEQTQKKRKAPTTSKCAQKENAQLKKWRKGEEARTSSSSEDEDEDENANQAGVAEALRVLREITASAAPEYTCQECTLQILDDSTSLGCDLCTQSWWHRECVQGLSAFENSPEKLSLVCKKCQN